jgi:hypothetical protein
MPRPPKKERRPVKPDRQLVWAAKRLTTAANVHTIHKALAWYEHWCRLGNEAAAEASAMVLQRESAKR